MMKKRVVITGGSGFLGMNLARALVEKEYDVCVVSRNAPKELGAIRFSKWDGHSLGEWAKELDGATAVVNLAGRSVDCPKTPENCDEILRSRTESTKAVGQGIRSVRTPPKVWVQMSTAHIHGDPETGVMAEDSDPGFGFAPEVGKAWEEAYAGAVMPGIRQVVLRTSFVLGKNGGAMKRLAALAGYGLGGTIGNGKQGISWIHQDDMNGLFIRAIENDDMKDIYLATAPDPVSNKVFMRTLRKAVRMPIGLPTPAFLLRLGAKLLNTDPELALYGRFCRSVRLEKERFKFKYPEIDGALRSLV